MNFDLSEEQKLLRDQAQRFLNDSVSYDKLRALIQAGKAMDETLWREIAELGWLAVAIPEEYGGMGQGPLEQCVLAEELGRSVAPVPFVSSLGLAAETLLYAGTEEQKSMYLPRLASGETIGTVALFEGAGAPSESFLLSQVTRERAGHLTGHKWPVLDGGPAHLFVVSAARENGDVGLFLVDSASRGVKRARLDGFDQLRSGWAVDFADAPCVPLGARDAREVIEHVFDRAAVLTAFEQVGGAQSCLDMALAYAKERRAFGRAVGSFQAIKHKLADMLVKIELARSNAYYAGWAAANDAADSALAAASARISAIEAYEFAARENMQVHGGISFTWEANCHFHYRRSRLLAVNLGGADHWNRRVIAQLRTRPGQIAANTQG